jgi:putative aminopeptidase FrvX
VRAAVLAAMPPWARERAQTDAIGNVWVAVGPPRDTTVFMAHMDEVGYEITDIAADGTVSLDGRGGVIPSAWEGQPARVQLDSARQSASAATVRELDGVFLTRADPEEKRPRDVRAWFGLDAAGLARAGVTVGMGVTGYKEGHRIGRHRYTGRSLDDRAGATALLLALRALDAASLDRTVIFAWSVHEEGGLNGAAAMAARFGASTRRIYSVDTFVSSDTPLESPHFAYAPLGKGPVFRAIESANVSPDEERARARRVAAAAGIPLQMGLTQGGTDGSVFTFWGAPNQGLSWPGRYSHSPGEVLDLRDLDMLTRLVVAVASMREP